MNSDLIWPLGCTVVGAVILVFGIRLQQMLQRSKVWPKTFGTIIESGVQSKWEGSGGRYQYVVSPKVNYEYEVAGRRYKSSQLALIEFNSSDADSASRKAASYSAGQKVEVYYDPRKPSFATLQVGDPTGGALPIGMIIFAAAVTTAGLIWLLKIA